MKLVQYSECLVSIVDTDSLALYCIIVLYFFPGASLIKLFTHQSLFGHETLKSIFN